MLNIKILCYLLSVGLTLGVIPRVEAFSDAAVQTRKAQPSQNFWMKQQQRSPSGEVDFQDPEKAKELSQSLNENPQTTSSMPQDAETLRQLLSVEEIAPPSKVNRVFPGSSLGVPTAYGAQWGDAWFGGAFSSANLFAPNADGSVALGMGFGDAKESVGLEVFTGIFNLSGKNTDIGGVGGNGGAVGFKLHHRLDDRGYFAVALGMENAIRWGTENAYGGNYDTYFGVFTGRFDLNAPPDYNESDLKQDPLLQEQARAIAGQIYDGSYNYMPLVVSVGLGSGAFRSKGALEAEEQNVNVFATAGLSILPQVSLISTWAGSQLNLGTSITPFNHFPIVLNIGAGDVTGVYPQGTRFIMSLGYGIKF